jgi:hypothetical protein
LPKIYLEEELDRTVVLVLISRRKLPQLKILSGREVFVFYQRGAQALVLM